MVESVAKSVASVTSYGVGIAVERRIVHARRRRREAGGHRRRIDFHAIGAGAQAGELIRAVGAGRGRGDDAVVDDVRSLTTTPWMPGLTGVLDAVPIQVVPDEIADACPRTAT